jgi:DMSO/TMAO reductase YedYZ heme-binding membrane subunit
MLLAVLIAIALLLIWALTSFEPIRRRHGPA